MDQTTVDAKAAILKALQGWEDSGTPTDEENIKWLSKVIHTKLNGSTGPIAKALMIYKDGERLRLMIKSGKKLGTDVTIYEANLVTNKAAFDKHLIDQKITFILDGKKPVFTKVV